MQMPGFMIYATCSCCRSFRLRLGWYIGSWLWRHPSLRKVLFTLERMSYICGGPLLPIAFWGKAFTPGKVQVMALRLSDVNSAKPWRPACFRALSPCRVNSDIKCIATSYLLRALCDPALYLQLAENLGGTPAVKWETSISTDERVGAMRPRPVASCIPLCGSVVPPLGLAGMSAFLLFSRFPLSPRCINGTREKSGKKKTTIVPKKVGRSHPCRTRFLSPEWASATYELRVWRVAETSCGRGCCEKKPRRQGLLGFRL